MHCLQLYAHIRKHVRANNRVQYIIVELNEAGRIGILIVLHGALDTVIYLQRYVRVYLFFVYLFIYLFIFSHLLFVNIMYKLSQLL